MVCSACARLPAAQFGAARRIIADQEGVEWLSRNLNSTCAHPSCSCKVPNGIKCCSDYCKKAPEVELHCNCMHHECRANM